jgi:hypothetical protein
MEIYLYQQILEDFDLLSQQQLPRRQHQNLILHKVIVVVALQMPLIKQQMQDLLQQQIVLWML